MDRLLCLVICLVTCLHLCSGCGTTIYVAREAGDTLDISVTEGIDYTHMIKPQGFFPIKITLDGSAVTYPGFMRVKYDCQEVNFNMETGERKCFIALSTNITFQVVGMNTSSVKLKYYGMGPSDSLNLCDAYKQTKCNGTECTGDRTCIDSSDMLSYQCVNNSAFTGFLCDAGNECSEASSTTDPTSTETSTTTVPTSTETSTTTDPTSTDLFSSTEISTTDTDTQGPEEKPTCSENVLPTAVWVPLSVTLFSLLSAGTAAVVYKVILPRLRKPHGNATSAAEVPTTSHGQGVNSTGTTARGCNNKVADISKEHPQNDADNDSCSRSRKSDSDEEDDRFRPIDPLKEYVSTTITADDQRKLRLHVKTLRHIKPIITRGNRSIMELNYDAV